MPGAEPRKRWPLTSQAGKSKVVLPQNRIMRRLCAISLLLLTFTISCSKKPAEKRYELQGEVVAIDSAAHQITVSHQDVPGLMPGMTMPFLVGPKEEWVFGKIGPG